MDPEGSGEERAEASEGSNGQTQGDTPSNSCQSPILHRRPVLLPYEE